MIVNSSKVLMQSSNKSSKVKEEIVTEKRFLADGKKNNKNLNPKDILSISEEAQKRLDEMNQNKIGATSDIKGYSNSRDFELNLLLEILQKMYPDKNFKTNIFEGLNRESSNNNAFLTNKLQNPNWIIERKTSYYEREEENTVFSTTGIAQTNDGRTIAFNVSLEMSRSFEQYYESSVKYSSALFKDPLVINLDSNPTSISDQTFFFDINADGKKEEISSLNKGSGFLAYDKNDDGIINDGSELFGAMTGDGFKELSKYDDDGNGWIDENDDIFNKLKIWSKDEKGKDYLITLKNAGVGAIYLGSASTEFSIKDSNTNEHNAQIRKTGVYLKENGTAGTIQQVDMAEHNKKE